MRFLFVSSFSDVHTMARRRGKHEYRETQERRVVRQQALNEAKCTAGGEFCSNVSAVMHVNVCCRCEEETNFARAYEIRTRFFLVSCYFRMKHKIPFRIYRAREKSVHGLC